MGAGRVRAGLPGRRTGGQPRRPQGRPVYAFDGRYQDIVADERIVYTYSMHVDHTLISVSVATVELQPKGAGGR
jgi:uncharacterized protein YndB with AHSA1/START domain